MLCLKKKKIKITKKKKIKTKQKQSEKKGFETSSHHNINFDTCGEVTGQM